MLADWASLGRRVSHKEWKICLSWLEIVFEVSLAVVFLPTTINLVKMSYDYNKHSSSSSSSSSSTNNYYMMQFRIKSNGQN